MVKHRPQLGKPAALLILLFLFGPGPRYHGHLETLSLLANPLDIDLGRIQQGGPVKSVVLLTNPSQDTLRILSVVPSSGCTITSLDKRIICIGDTGHLFVTFDPSSKADGPIRKTITINSNAPHAFTIITLRGIVTKAHPGTMSSLSGIFAGDCAQCHVEKGSGLVGADLYTADCAICHGAKKEDKPAPALFSKSMLRHGERDLYRIITSGIPLTNMPAFGSAGHGPLSEAQVQSLVQYIMSFKKRLGNSWRRLDP